jgi:hypothetical protein
VLLDTAGTTGKAYGAKTTPHMFVIDEQGKLIYNGAIDDDPSGRNETPKRRNYVDQALAPMARARRRSGEHAALRLLREVLSHGSRTA